MHKFNKDLLFFVGFTIMLIAAGIITLNNKKNLSVTEDETKNNPRDNVVLPGEKVQGEQPEVNFNIKDNQADTAEMASVRPISEQDHLWGPINAPVKIVVYDDFECPFCVKYYDTLEQVKKEFGDKVVIAFRHYPLTSIHPYAMMAAMSSECAGEQGKFWEMYKKLFADNRDDKMNEEQFKQDAADLGLDKVKFLQCLQTEKYKDRILADFLEGKSANVNGTPTTFINGEFIVGASPFEDYVGSDGVKTEGVKSIIKRYLPAQIN